VEISGDEESQEPSSPSSGGGGGGSNIVYVTPKKANIKMDFNDLIELERGKNLTLSGTINNTGEVDLDNLSFELSNFPILYYNFKPENLDIKQGEKKEFKLYLKIPDYYQSGRNDDFIIVKNDDETFRFNFTIISLTEEKSLYQDCLKKVEEQILESKDNGIGTVLFENKKEDSKNLFERQYYSDALALCQELLNEIDSGFKAKNEIDDVKERYFKLEKTFPEVNEFLELINKAFEQEEYLLAIERVEQLNKVLDSKEEEIQKSYEHRLKVLKENLYKLLIIISIIIILGVLIYVRRSISLLNKRIRLVKDKTIEYKEDNEALQKKYFINKEISRRQYERSKKVNDDKIAANEKKYYELRLKKLKILSGRKKKDLSLIKEQILESKKKLQESYYKDKKLDFQNYQRLNKVLEGLLLDTEERIGFDKNK
jgi:hypothetical protein